MQFQDNASNLGPAQTVGSGGQTTITTSTLSVGNHTITASFTSASANFNNSAGNITQTVNKARTTLAYDGALSADFNDPATLSATLTRTDNAAPIPGKTVTLTMAAETCAAMTAANGQAACAITPSEAAGPNTASAVFPGDSNYLAAATNTPFTVTREENTTTYTGPTVIAQSNPVTLSARLLEDGVTPIIGRTMTLTLGSGTGSQTCVTAPTDSTGNAHCTIATVATAQGPQPVTANFAGDGHYLPSSDTKSVIIFAFPARGVFTLGNQSVTTTAPMTFWDAQWAQHNALSSGGAPSSFKGFADTTNTKPPACGGTWTTSPGNSSSPVASIPAYMGTVVSSSIAKNGSTISGNITHIVVIVTAPGYDSNPGHPGTGTIIATYC